MDVTESTDDYYLKIDQKEDFNYSTLIVCYPVDGLLPIRVQLTYQRTFKSMETRVLQDLGSTVTQIDESIKETLKSDTKDCKRKLAGANSSKRVTEGVK